MSMHFDLTDLRLLAEVAEVAEANSVTGGAQALHLSVPAASTRIKNLEESIGAKLLLRAERREDGSGSLGELPGVEDRVVQGAPG